MSIVFNVCSDKLNGTVIPIFRGIHILQGHVDNTLLEARVVTQSLGFTYPSRNMAVARGPGAQWLKCNGTQGNAVPPPPIYDSMRSPPPIVNMLGEGTTP